MDERIFRQYYGGNGSTTVLGLMIAASIVGSGWMMFGLIPMFFFERTRQFAASLLAIFTVTGIAVVIFKVIVRRPRPCNSLSGVHGLFGTPNDFSFPSGHASGSFAFALFVVALSLYRARREPARAPLFFLLGAFVIGLAATICFSRIYLGAHFPGDVLGGAILGGTLGALGGRWHVSRLASEAASDTK